MPRNYSQVDEEPSQWILDDEDEFDDNEQAKEDLAMEEGD
jgi:hypothetical protein